MKYVKSILSAIVVFIFGLEVGVIGTWHIIMSDMNAELAARRAYRERKSYVDHRE